MRLSLRLTRTPGCRLTKRLNRARPSRARPPSTCRCAWNTTCPPSRLTFIATRYPGSPCVRRDALGDQQQTAEQRALFRREVVERRDVRLRDDEAVKRRLRMNVLERQHLAVLVDAVGGQLAGHDPAEQAFLHPRPSPPSFIARGLDLATAAERSSQCPAVDVLELAADGDTVGDAARPQAVLVRQGRNEVGRRIAFDGHARGEHDLREALRAEPALEQRRARAPPAQCRRSATDAP